MSVNQIRARLLPWARTRKPTGICFWTRFDGGMRVIGTLKNITGYTE